MTYLARKILRLKKLESLLDEVAANGVASESISTPNGGSRSISYTSSAQISEQINNVKREISLLTGSGIGIKYNNFGVTNGCRI